MTFNEIIENLQSIYNLLVKAESLTDENILMTLEDIAPLLDTQNNYFSNIVDRFLPSHIQRNIEDLRITLNLLQQYVEENPNSDDILKS